MRRRRGNLQRKGKEDERWLKRVNTGVNHERKNMLKMQMEDAMSSDNEKQRAEM